MKRLMMSFGVLCMTLLLFCGTAMAAAPELAPGYKDTVSVTETKKGDDPAYTVSRTGTEAGQLYLVLILKGNDSDTTDAAPLPNKDNVYYMDVKAAEGSSVTFDAYPKAMEKGTYIVYLSDYNNAGAAKGVARIVVGDSGSAAVLYGDVNGDDKVSIKDVSRLQQYLAGWSVEINSGADANGDEKVSIKDVSRLQQHLAGWSVTLGPKT